MSCYLCFGHGLNAESQFIFSIGIFSAVALLIRYVVERRAKRLDFPVVGRAVAGELKKDMLEGSAKYPTSPYILPVQPPIVILPPCVLEEVRNLPESEVSFFQIVRDGFNYRYTNIGEERLEMLAALKGDLTRNINGALDCLQDELKYALDQSLGPCTDWQPVPIYPALTRIVTLMSGRLFVGLPLSRNEEWIHSSISFTQDAVAASDAIREWNILLRPFVAPFSSAIRRVKRHSSRAGELLAPIIKQKIAEAQFGKSKERAEDQQGALIGWILSHTKESEKYNPTVMGHNQMTLSFVAIHSTSMAACQIIYDLLVHPEYQQPLRSEINQVLKEDGPETTRDGTENFKKSSIPKLRKLDSFMKESQRLSPAGILANARITQKPLTLSTGHHLPAGTKFAFPLWSINLSTASETYSPAYNPPDAKPLTEFDGFRFHKLRNMPGKEKKHQFVTTAPDSLSFGHGNHACPGRFFASCEIKLLLIELLRVWELRFQDGGKGEGDGEEDGDGGKVERPADLLAEGSIYPNPFTVVEMRRRRVVSE